MRGLTTTAGGPVGLVDKQYGPSRSEGIAPGRTGVGVMRPANPLQHVLSQELNSRLMATCGNLNGKPPAVTKERDLYDLQHIAEGVLFDNSQVRPGMNQAAGHDSGQRPRPPPGHVDG
ncbi:Sua5/YciO/YrdC/YwlC family protein, partial [Salmonella enterica]|uniref:Sua5/YciO/YrdC/YwlC family protein n=1 Tax=Salmonella enterica TaxID=28901 RepID=UPI00398C3BAC